jgi:hypothetical protein
LGELRYSYQDSPVEARACVADAATEGGQPAETVMEEEVEQTLMFSQGEKEEHSKEWLKIFSQEAEQEMTAALKPAAEEEADNMDFVDLCEELEALERRVMVQSLHIQQAKLEEGSGAYQPQEKLEEAGSMPAGEMAAAELPQEEAEQQFSEETAELESAAEWPLSATKRDKDSMGDQADLPIEKTEVQQRRLHTKSQPLEQLDEIIEEIRRLMIRSAEAVSKEKLSRREPARAAGKKQQQQQQHSWRGADGQLQGKVWDPGGFQHWRRGAHDQEIMIFPAEEYDAGASLHVSSVPASQHIQHTLMEKGRGTTLSILKFEISINVVRLLMPDHAFVQEVVEVALMVTCS